MSAEPVLDQTTAMIEAIRQAQDRIRLKTRGRARWYEVLGDDGEWHPAPGVTSILDVIDKPGLPYWAANLQFDADILTAWDIFRSGQAFATLEAFDKAFRAQAPAKKAHVTELRKAADTGKDVHRLIETHLQKQMGLTVADPDVSDEAYFIFAGFEKWAASVGLRPLMVEGRLASFKYHYAGTMDGIGLVTIQDGVTVLEWKTSKEVYWNMKLQNIGYRNAIFEMTGVMPQGLIVRVPKDGGAIVPEPVKDDPAKLLDAFVHFRAVYPHAKEAGLL